MSEGPSFCDDKPVRPVCPMADGVSSGSDQRFTAVQTDSREQAIDFEDAPESSIRKPRIADPMLPTEVSVKEHELTHLPYRFLVSALRPRTWQSVGPLENRAESTCVGNWSGTHL